ncbi:MAG: hypothetical protein R3349_07270, partial [Geminicoccaceae bacterium]|nr:hypothetical protein [Geminicoccaceae bacterium]
AEPAVPSPPESEAPARPEGVPEKFWDPEAGAVRTEALVKSYRELERKLSRMVPLPDADGDEAGQERLRRALGVPESADGYEIRSDNELIQPDEKINARLLEAGFNQRQAQMVYDLAAEYVVPMVNEAVADVTAERDVERLASHFGSGEAWRTVAEQIKTWGKANLPGETMEVLSSNFEGILAMHHMMRASEPRVVQGADGAAGVASEAGLRELMRDPRYWRDRDPAIVARVTEGFARLYPR